MKVKLNITEDLVAVADVRVLKNIPYKIVVEAEALGHIVTDEIPTHQMYGKPEDAQYAVEHFSMKEVALERLVAKIQHSRFYVTKGTNNAF